MFLITEADAAAIATAMNSGGALAATAELRRRFPGITDAAEAHRWAETIAGWKPIAPTAVRSRHRKAPSKPR